MSLPMIPADMSRPRPIIQTVRAFHPVCSTWTTLRKTPIIEVRNKTLVIKRAAGTTVWVTTAAKHSRKTSAEIFLPADYHCSLTSGALLPLGIPTPRRRSPHNSEF